MASPSESSALPLDDAVQGPPRPRRPLTGLVGSLVVGLCLGLVAAEGSTWWAMTGSVVCAAVGLWVGRAAVGSLLLHGAVLLTGMAWMQMEVGLLARDDLRSHLVRERQYVEITGVIRSMPRVEDRDARGKPVWLFDAHAESVPTTKGPATASGRFRVRMVGDDAEPPAYGDRWHWRGTFRLDDRSAPRRQGVVGSMMVRAGFAARLGTGQGHPFVAWCYAQRGRAAAVLGRGLEADASSVAFTRALLLGLRGEVPPQVHDAFARTGTLHILALSGMHVGILVLLLVVALKACGVTRPHWVLFFIPFLVTYTLATGAAASTVRASVMASVYFLAYLVRRRPDPPTTLALAALLILVVEPLQIFDFGFILSFVVVAGLMVLVRPMTLLLRGAADEGDPWQMVERPGWEKGLRGLWERGVDLFSVSLSAWLASLPLIAGLFYLISPSALVVNLPLIPAAFIILLTGCLSLISGAVLPPLANVFNHANALFCDGLMGLVDRAAQIPGSHFYVQPWPWYVVGLWFILLVVMAYRRGWVRVLVSLVLVALVAGSIMQRRLNKQVNVVLLPAGDAMTVLIDGPGDRALLLDAGAAYRSRALVELVRSRGIDRLDRVWLTRATADAYGGLDDLLDAVPVDEVFAPKVPAALHHYLARREGWVARLGAERVKPWPDVGELNWGDDVLIRVLYPLPGEAYRHARQSAQILHIAQGHRSFMYVSRADEDMEARAALIPQDVHADVLAVGLIDTVSGLSDAWLDRVTPEKLLYTSRAFDRMHASAEPLHKRLEARGAMEVMRPDDLAPVVLRLSRPLSPGAFHAH